MSRENLFGSSRWQPGRRLVSVYEAKAAQKLLLKQGHTEMYAFAVVCEASQVAIEKVDSFINLMIQSAKES
jgi:hypothetical protein